MLRPTIRKRILGIAIGLIVLMAITSALSTVMTRRIAHQLEELSTKYVEAYGHLARMNIRSLEQALALGVDAVLLDNMTLEDLRQAVKMAGGKVITEASGRITAATAPARSAETSSPGSAGAPPPRRRGFSISS